MVFDHVGARRGLRRWKQYCTTDTPDGDACDETWSLNEYGRLYNWYSVDDARGLCQSGWHVPTDEGDCDDGLLGWRYRRPNKNGLWVTQWRKRHELDGFSGLPGGRLENGSSVALEATEADGVPRPSEGPMQDRYLSSYNESVYRSYDYNQYGFSVRCIKTQNNRLFTSLGASCLASVGRGQDCEYPYTLTVDSFPAIQPGLTTYRVYVDMPDSSNYIRIIGSNEFTNDTMVLTAPSGVYNSEFGGITAEFQNPALFGLHPELQDDSFITIGLDGQAFLSKQLLATAIWGDAWVENELEDGFFTISGSTDLVAFYGDSPNWEENFSLGMINPYESVNAIADENGRVLIMQVTTAGLLSGTLPMRFGLRNESYNEFSVIVSFDGPGIFPIPAVQGCLTQMHVTTSMWM